MSIIDDCSESALGEIVNLQQDSHALSWNYASKFPTHLAEVFRMHLLWRPNCRKMSAMYNPTIPTMRAENGISALLGRRQERTEILSRN